jgi:hypothetical protein
MDIAVPIDQLQQRRRPQALKSYVPGTLWGARWTCILRAWSFSFAVLSFACVQTLACPPCSERTIIFDHSGWEAIGAANAGSCARRQTSSNQLTWTAEVLRNGLDHARR